MFFGVLGLVVLATSENVPSNPSKSESSSPITFPIGVWYSAANKDNFVSPQIGDPQVPDSSYALSNEGDGMASTNSSSPPTGDLALYRFYNDKLKDTLVTSSQEGVEYAKSNGYSAVGVIGALSSCSEENPGRLEQWYSSERNDHFLVGSAENRAAAEGANYVKLDWDEGCSGWMLWPDAPPSNCPFPKSTVAHGIEFDPSTAGTYGAADTWYPAWSQDDELLSPFTDGVVNGVRSHSYDGANAVQGHAVILGNDPTNLTVTNVGITNGSALPYQGRYPSTSFVKGNTWFYGTYSLEDWTNDCGNWCNQGPWVSLRYSTDKGTSWTEPRPQMKSWNDSIFGEEAINGSRVRFGAPHAVDFGKDMEHSPDGKVYVVGHGAQRGEPQSWMQGSEVFMARAEISTETINYGKYWDFFNGGDSWTTGNVSNSKPLFTWVNRTGVVTQTYIPALKQFIMVVSTPTTSPSTVGTFDTYFLSSPTLTGPFSIITYLQAFGPQAYFVNIPSKFISPNITVSSTGQAYLEFFLSYSANFAYKHSPNPPPSGYHWTLLRSRLLLN